ncbi:MAG: helix-turn-helix transcriptional regulator [Clostridia bacterium]|nr:helix-turn-helix transcriptional regulator [Clostridia bacterium]
MKIGENIRKIRRGKNMTQETLADYLGVTVSAVS